MLAKTGIASMAEMLDLHGVWTIELLQLMIPVALEIEADASMQQFSASAAAVSVIGGKKGAEAFVAGVRQTKRVAKDMMRATRGLGPEKPVDAPGETAAEQFLNVVQAMGLRPPTKRKKGPPRDTKIHRGK